MIPQEPIVRDIGGLSSDERIRLEALNQAVASINTTSFENSSFILDRATAFENYLRGIKPGKDSK